MLVVVSRVDAAALGELGHTSLNLCAYSPVTACVIFCRVARRYAASVTAAVKSGRVHSSRRRGRIGKALLEAGALLTASAVADSTEPAQGNVCAGSHLPRLLTLSPLRALA